MLVVAISVGALCCCCCFSYHALLSLHYKSCPAKTAVTKKLAQEAGISVREAERCLEADVFLDEYLRWEPGRLHHLFLLQWIYTHAQATRQKECDHAICWGHQQPLPEWDLSVEVPAIKLVGFKMTWEEIWRVYNEVYQLKRAPGAEPCDTETVENICQEILDSINEHLHCRQDHAQPMEEPGWRSTSTSRPDPQPKFQRKTCATYVHFKDIKEGSGEEALAVGWDFHRQALQPWPSSKIK